MVAEGGITLDVTDVPAVPDGVEPDVVVQGGRTTESL